MARRLDRHARLWEVARGPGRRDCRRSASAWTPATRTPAARSWPGSSTGSRRSPAGSTWCTPTTPATSSTPAPTGTPTSAPARSTRSDLVAVVSAAGAPVVCETPGRRRGPGRRHRLPARAPAGLSRPAGPASGLPRRAGLGGCRPPVRDRPATPVAARAVGAQGARVVAQRRAAPATKSRPAAGRGAGRPASARSARGGRAAPRRAGRGPSSVITA